MFTRPYKDKFRCVEKYKDLSGAWRSVSVIIDKNTAQKRKEAQRTLDDMIARKTLAGKDYDLQRLYNVYIAEQKLTLKKQTWRRNEATGNRLVKILGNPSLKNLTAGYIREKLLTYTQTPGTLNEYIKRLKSVIRWGYQNDLITSTACVDKLNYFKDDERKAKLSVKYLEKDELKAVINAASPYYASVIEFIALSGLRIGEVLALEDKDVTDKYIKVTKTFDSQDKTVDTPKTADSIRNVDIQPELAAVVSRIRKASKTNKVKNGTRSPRFIIGPLGAPLSYYKFNRTFKELTKEVTGKELTTHALRHTHVSLLAESGVPLETITRRLGHSDSKITREIYLHVTKKMREKDAEIIRNIVLLEA